jgi:hypothetical protein
MSKEEIYLIILNLTYEQAKEQGIDDFFKFKEEDEELNEFIDEQIEDGILTGIEIFKRNENILATENGYYI